MLPKEMVLWERVAFLAGLALLFATMWFADGLGTKWQLGLFAAGCVLGGAGVFRHTKRKLAVEGRGYAVELALPLLVLGAVLVAALLAHSAMILIIGYVAVLGLFLLVNERDIRRAMKRRDIGQ